MIQSLNTTDLTEYVVKQINLFFPDGDIASSALSSFVKKAVERTEFCFSKINIKYFFDSKNVYFNHLNTDQYAMFLCYLSNTIWREEKNEKLAAKIYCLNKALHGLDAFYEVELPDIFVLIHPVGTVLGRAKYEDYFVAYQRVTVGGNKNLEYPGLGKAVAMFPGSAIIGNCKTGDNCLISIGTVVLEKDVPSNTVVFGTHQELQFKKTTKTVLERFFLA